MKIYDNHTHLNDKPFAGKEADYIQKARDLDVVGMNCVGQDPEMNLGALELAKRFANVKDAYVCRTGVDLSGMRLLLLDDVITTGATISACAKALLEGGAVSVDGVCVAATELMPKSHGAAGTPKESK